MLAFDYARPETFEEVISLLVQGGPETRLLAGGTDLVVGIRQHAVQATLLIDLKRVEGVRSGIREDNGWLVIPAGTTMSDLAKEPKVRHHFFALFEAVRVVGSVQIRNRATLAGNLCNASPAADTVPILALYDSVVDIAGPQGIRTMLVNDFVRGNRDTALAPGDVVTSVRLPIPQVRVASVFERIARRRGVDLATVNLGCSVSEAGSVRFALGAVAPRPVLVEGVGDDLDELLSVAAPISDVRAGAAYRRAMLVELARRALNRARAAL